VVRNPILVYKTDYFRLDLEFFDDPVIIPYNIIDSFRVGFHITAISFKKGCDFGCFGDIILIKNNWNILKEARLYYMHLDKKNRKNKKKNRRTKNEYRNIC